MILLGVVLGIDVVVIFGFGLLNVVMIGFLFGVLG